MSFQSYLRFLSSPLAKSAHWRLLVLSIPRFHGALRTAQSFCWVRRSAPRALAAPRSSVRALEAQSQLLKDVGFLSVDHDDQEVPNKPFILGEDRGSDLRGRTARHDASETQKKAKPSSKDADSAVLSSDAALSKEYDASSFLAPSGSPRSPSGHFRNDSHISDAADWSRDNQGEECDGSKKRFQVKRILNANHAVPRNDGYQNARWFPYLDQFRIKDETVTSSEILQMLAPFLSEERRRKIDMAAGNRTYSVCPVVEGLSDLGNISAVFRSAEALGFQSVHVISNETTKRYKRNRKVSMGTEKWLDAELWGATKECLETLRSRGYRIAVAHAADDTASIFDLDWTVPTAVVFGNENQGVSMDALQMSDIRFCIPMGGMVDSFNVSVAAGIVMHHAVHDRIARWGKHGDLSPEEQKILSADFYIRHNSKTSSMIDWLVQKKQAGKKTTLTSVLRGELEMDIGTPEYLKIKHENTSQKKDT